MSGQKSYQDLLGRVKTQIRTAQGRAAVAVNQELVLLYWGIGKASSNSARRDARVYNAGVCGRASHGGVGEWRERSSQSRHVNANAQVIYLPTVLPILALYLPVARAFNS